MALTHYKQNLDGTYVPARFISAEEHVAELKTLNKTLARAYPELIPDKSDHPFALAELPRFKQYFVSSLLPDLLSVDANVKPQSGAQNITLGLSQTQPLIPLGQFSQHVAISPRRDARDCITALTYCALDIYTELGKTDFHRMLPRGTIGYSFLSTMRQLPANLGSALLRVDDSHEEPFMIPDTIAQMIETGMLAHITQPANYKESKYMIGDAERAYLDAAQISDLQRKLEVIASHPANVRRELNPEVPVFRIDFGLHALVNESNN